MSKNIEYFLSPASPWAYLGHQRFCELAKSAGADVSLKPIDPTRLFSASGGLPLGQRPIQRQKYRLMELRRWKSFLKSEITIEPKFFPYNPTLAALIIIACQEHSGIDSALMLTNSLFEGCWVHNKNMADEAELNVIIEEAGLDSSAIIKLAKSETTEQKYEKNTDEAIELGLFGVPTYVIENELFWGQDRLEFVREKISR